MMLSQQRSRARLAVGRTFRPAVLVMALTAAALLLGGCGLFGAAGEATPVPTRTPLPTFTPTTQAPPAAAEPSPTVPPVADTAPLTGVEALAAAQPVTAGQPMTTADSAAPAPTATPIPATLTITSDLVNVRSGPGTEYDLVGTAATGETFTVLAKNAAGDWWQVCCVADQNGWVFGELASVQNGDAVAVAADLAAAPPAATEAAPAASDAAPTTPAAPDAAAEAAPTEAPATEVAAEPTPAPPAAAAPYDPHASSEGNFDPNAQYQITYFHVRGLDENNGGIRDSAAQHLIFVTVLDANGNGVDGAVVRNLVGEGGEWTTGNKGPGMTEIPMYYEPFKLTVATDPSGAVTSQVSNQMGLIFPHLPDIVGKLGDVNYEYGVCPTIDIKCGWPLSDYQYVHFSYDITFQKVK